MTSARAGGVDPRAVHRRRSSRRGRRPAGAPGFDHGDGTSRCRAGWLRRRRARRAGLRPAGGGGDVGHDAVVGVAARERAGRRHGVEHARASRPRTCWPGDRSRPWSPATRCPSPGRRRPGPSIRRRWPRSPGTYELDAGGTFDGRRPTDDGLAVAAAGPDAVAALFPLAGRRDRRRRRARTRARSRPCWRARRREGREERAAAGGRPRPDRAASTCSAPSSPTASCAPTSRSRGRRRHVLASGTPSTTTGASAAAEVTDEPPDARRSCPAPAAPSGPTTRRARGPTSRSAFAADDLTVTGPDGTTAPPGRRA